MAVSSSNPSILYVATGTIRKSTDGGLTWQFADDGLPDGAATTLAVHPHNPDVVFLGLPLVADGGIYETRDGGISWAKSTCTLGVPNVITIDPEHPDVIYAGGQSGFYISTDGGFSWSVSSLDSEDVIDIAINPQDSNNIFVATRGSAIYESSDGGASWHWEGFGWPEDGNEFYSSWCLIFDNNSPSTLYAGGDTGLFKYDVNSRWWSKTSTVIINDYDGTPRSLVHSSSIGNQGTGALFARFSPGDNIYQNTGTGGTGAWSLIPNESGLKFGDLYVDPANQKRLFATTNKGLFAYLHE